MPVKVIHKVEWNKSILISQLMNVFKYTLKFMYLSPVTEYFVTQGSFSIEFFKVKIPKHYIFHS